MEAYVTVPTALVILAGLFFFVMGRAYSNSWFSFNRREKKQITGCGIALLFVGMLMFFLAFFVQIVYPVLDKHGFFGAITSDYATSLPTSQPTAGNIIPTALPNITPTPISNWGQILQDLIVGSLDTSAGEFLASFFEMVNEADSKEDLSPLWESLSYGFQQASSKGNRNSFIDFWYSVRVSYVIQQCSRSVVDVKLTYFNRADEARLNPRSQDYLRYTLEVNSGNWVIVNGNRLNDGVRLCEGF